MSEAKCKTCSVKLDSATAAVLGGVCIHCSPFKVRLREFATCFLIGSALVPATMGLLYWSSYLFDTPRSGPGIDPGAVPALLAIWPGVASAVLLASSFSVLGRPGGLLSTLLGLTLLWTLFSLFRSLDKRFRDIVFLPVYVPALALVVYGVYLVVMGRKANRLGGVKPFRVWLK